MSDVYQSVLLIGALNAFAKMTENGIVDFETYANEPDTYEGWLIYDKRNGKVVCDKLVDELHRDIVGYYDFFPGVEIKVFEDDDGAYVDVTLSRGSIVVEEGMWYVSCYD